MHNDESDKTKLKAINKISSEMVHDIRTPLLSINFGANGLEKFLPRLIEGYEYALKHGLQATQISTDSLNTLKDITTNIQANTTKINKRVDIFWESISKETDD